MCVVTTAAIDIHRPDVSSDLFSVDVPLKLGSQGAWVSSTSASASESASCSTGSSVTGAPSDSSQTLCSSRACSTARGLSSEPRPAPPPLSPPPPPPVAETTVQDLLSSLSDDPCPSQGAWDPAPFAQPSPAGSPQTSPELAHRVSLLNRRNQEGFPVLQLKPTLHFQAPPLHPFSSLESKEQALHRVPEA